MRVTNMYMVEMSQAAMSKNQTNVAQISQEVSSGLRVAKPSDDPTAWLEAQREKVQSALNDGTKQALQDSTTRLNATDGALASLSTVISQAKAIAIEGGNASLDAISRGELSQQATALFQSAIAAANSKGPDGSYLLSGTSGTQPFDPTTGAYLGNAGTTSVNVDTTTTSPASLSGVPLTAANGVDILPTLNALATALSTNNAAGLQTAIGNLTTAVTQISQARSQVGGMMDTMQSATSAHEALSTTLQSSISNFVDADAVQSASSLAQASTALQVSQAVTTHVLSLLQPSSSG
jgi:flagellar hook-associated protein 3 FlgL